MKEHCALVCAVCIFTRVRRRLCGEVLNNESGNENVQQHDTVSLERRLLSSIACMTSEKELLYSIRTTPHE